jgi:trans-aconitate methyltransferase
MASPPALDPASHERLDEFYGSALSRFGPRHSMAVWWASRQAQERRFEVLAEAGEWEGATVADVGCGLGDLFAFLEARGLSVRYEGYDINARMLEAARAKHPHPRARFARRDVAATGLPRRFDYVVASGTFNIRVRRHADYLRRALEAMYAGCRRAVAFNVLTPIPPGHPDEEMVRRLYGDRVFYHAPLSPLAAWCRRLARRVEVRTGYRDWDASLLLFR